MPAVPSLPWTSSSCAGPKSTTVWKSFVPPGCPGCCSWGPTSSHPNRRTALEDWIRLPAEDGDVRVRVATLEAPGERRPGQARGRRRRLAALPGRMGVAVAGRARARSRAGRPVRCGRGARVAGSPSVAERRADPQRARRARAPASAPDRAARARGAHRALARLPAPGDDARRDTTGQADDADNMDVGEILLDILVVLVAAKLAAEIAERIGFPVVVGEIVAGIVIGPSRAGLGQSPTRRSASSLSSA